MSKGLILKNDIAKENFNILRLKTDNVSQFLAYYAFLLTTACEYGLVSKLEAENISKEILESFNKQFNYNPIIMANNMYALTSYLQSMPNTKQLEKLIKLSASELFEEASIWFLQRINELQRELLKIRIDVYKLQEEDITSSFQYLVETVNELKNYSQKETKCNLKELHKSAIILQYSFLPGKLSDKRENIIKNLEDIISNFVIEIRILSKLNPNEIIKNLKDWKKDSLNVILRKFENQKSVIERQIEKTRNRFKEELEVANKKSKEIERMFELIEKEDRKKFKEDYPNLKGKAFDDAFEEWQLSLPDSHFQFDGCEFDLVDETEKISSRYSQRILILEEKLKEIDETSAKRFLQKDADETIDLSVYTALKLLAIFEASKRNQIEIPQDFNQLKEFLERIPLKTAIDVVLQTIKPNLSEAEISYLKE